MVVGEIAEQADLLVVGGGPGGYVAALRAAQLGRRVVLVDAAGEAGLGGSCLHVGCIPSKALIELAHTADRVAGLRDAGLSVDGLHVDLGAFQAWKDGIVADLARGVRELLARAGVRVVRGHARFSHPRRVAVQLPAERVAFFEFEDAIVATGSRPAALPGLPWSPHVLDSTGTLALAALPASVAVVGAGYIGVEIGTALAKLGARVTLVEAAARILPGLDPALTRPVHSRLRALGVDVRTATRATGHAGGRLAVTGAADGATVDAETVVVAVGRVPNTDDLGLDRAGIAVGAGGLIATDERMLAAPNVAAIGDVVAGPALAHRASAQGRVAAEALSGRPAAFDPTAIPAVVFSDPEIASVGLDAAAARAAGLRVRAASFPLAASARARTLGATAGAATVVVDADGDRIVGIHVVGPHASELAGEATLAVETMAAPDDLAGTIHPHPTMSEALHEAVELVLGRPLHVAAHR